MKNIILALTLLSFVFILSCSSSTGSDDSPTITFVHPQNNETITDSIYTIEVSIEDTKSIVYVTISADTFCLYQTTNKNYTCEWQTYWFTNSADHTIKVEAIDSDDKTTTKSINVTLSDEAYATPKPLTPADNATLQNPVNFSWTALPQAMNYEIHITINDTIYPPYYSTTTTYSNSFLIYGPATWQVKAQNWRGQESKLSEVYHFTLNETKK